MQIYSTEYLQTDSQEYIKKIIHRNQVNLVSEIRGYFNIQKSVNMTYINKLKDKKRIKC